MRTVLEGGREGGKLDAGGGGGGVGKAKRLREGRVRKFHTHELAHKSL